MSIRSAQPSDAPAIARLHAYSWQTAYRGILRDDFLDGPLLENRIDLWTTRLSEPIRPDQITLVKEFDGALCGFACAFLDQDPQWGTLLDNLHVVPELKGRGLGRQLMSTIAARVATQASKRQLHLWAYEQNLAARRFYESLGGALTACHSEPALDGTHVNAVRYCWHELSQLADVSAQARQAT